jgi:hypothetical protein
LQVAGQSRDVTIAACGVYKTSQAPSELRFTWAWGPNLIRPLSCAAADDVAPQEDDVIRQNNPNDPGRSSLNRIST